VALLLWFGSLLLELWLFERTPLGELKVLPWKLKFKPVLMLAELDLLVLEVELLFDGGGRLAIGGVPPADPETSTMLSSKEISIESSLRSWTSTREEEERIKNG